MEDTILSKLIANGRDISMLRRALASQSLAHVVQLILDSDQIAARRRKPWKFKPLSEYVEEYFVTRTTPWWVGNDSWDQALLSTYAERFWFYVTVALEGEGLSFFVADGPNFREATVEDADYAFIHRLYFEEGMAIGDFSTTKPPRWSERLYVSHDNSQAYEIIWSSAGNCHGEEHFKAMKAKAVRLLANQSQLIEPQQKVRSRIDLPRPDARLIRMVAATQARFWQDWREGMPRPKSVEEIQPWIRSQFPELSGADVAAVDRISCVIDRNPSQKKR